MPTKTKRGVSPSEYLFYWRKVDRGETTWRELELAGIVKPAVRKTNQPLAKRLAARLAAFRKRRAAK
jgi:hypothetical protein